MKGNSVGFTIHKLDKRCYERQDGAHPARSPFNCFFYLSEGTVLVDIGERTCFIQADDLVFIPAGQIFKVRYYEESRGFMGGFHSNCILGADLEANTLSRFNFLRIWGNPKINLDSLTSSHINALFQRIYEEMLLEAPDQEIIKAYLNAVLVEADAVYKRVLQHKKTHIEEENFCSSNEALSNRFLDMLFHASDSQKKLPVADYAGKLNITPNHLNKVVKRVTGKNPSEWIEEAIMVKAKFLLRNTGKPLGEIASELGIDDQSYFTRRFKLHEGVTPTQYRSLSSISGK
ncbi:MAG: AraC family transcriptional regulator [Bacteroidales bacterium]|nr:AraC family transcriptional regulator [Bacteroidales bacterium]